MPDPARRIPTPAFCRRTRELLDLERDAEIEENRRIIEKLSVDERSKRGLTIVALRCEDIGFGFGGRPQIDLVRTTGEKIPDHRFQSGDVVEIAGKELEGEPPRGVLSRVWPDRLRVVLDGDLETDLKGKLRLERVANDVTHRRMLRALDSLETAGPESPGRRAREIAFDGDPCDEVRAIPAEPYDTSLNESQRAAVAHSIGTSDLALIHGPPGTGKTTTVAELIHQATALGERVIACAPSNVAVDNLAEKLVARGVQIVRVGHPARLFPALVERSLDALVERSTSQKLIHDLRRDLDVAQKRMVRAKDHFERRSLREEIRHLRRGVREIEAGVVRGILQGADCVLATLTGAADRKFEGLEFDLAVVDEAGQAIEPATWIPILKARRSVLAGDHKQLPPTIRSRRAEHGGLGVTLFERLAEANPHASHMLDVQYRMHEAIMNWASAASYQNQLIAHESVKSHTLSGIDGVAETDETRHPLFFIDTAGFDASEQTDDDGVSRWNDGEARLVEVHVRRLIEAGVDPKTIGVITPYAGQVDRLRSRLRPEFGRELEIDTVDGFQGREKEAVVMSLVRSNSDGIVGFLADARRMNVAVTRARRHCAIIADSATVCADDGLAGVVEHFQALGEYRSAYDYPAE